MAYCGARGGNTGGVAEGFIHGGLPRDMSLAGHERRGPGRAGWIERGENRPAQSCALPLPARYARLPS